MINSSSYTTDIVISWFAVFCSLLSSLHSQDALTPQIRTFMPIPAQMHSPPFYHTNVLYSFCQHIYHVSLISMSEDLRATGEVPEEYRMSADNLCPAGPRLIVRHSGLVNIRLLQRFPCQKKRRQSAKYSNSICV
jgi:hypothetical protein